MELNLKYNAIRVDEIEKSRKLPLENCISDTSIDCLSLFIQKGLIDDNGVHGVSKTVAMSTIDKYLEEKDKDDLILDITEALMNAGFLSRGLDMKKMREAKAQRLVQANEELEKSL